MFKKILPHIETMICSYLGLDREEARAKDVRYVGNKLIVTHTTSYKRHAMTLSWEEYTNQKRETFIPTNLQRLGQAAGKSIAKNLIISFKDPNVAP